MYTLVETAPVKELSVTLPPGSPDTSTITPIKPPAPAPVATTVARTETADTVEPPDSPIKTPIVATPLISASSKTTLTKLARSAAAKSPIVDSPINIQAANRVAVAVKIAAKRSATADRRKSRVAIPNARGARVDVVRKPVMRRQTRRFTAKQGGGARRQIIGFVRRQMQ